MTAQPPIYPWYDALLLLRRALPSPDTQVHWLLENVEPGYMQERSHRAAETTRLQDGRVEVSLHASTAALPRIELTELWLYAAAGVWFEHFYDQDVFRVATPREAFQGLCEKVGCHFTNTPDIRERWRCMDYKTPAHLLPLAIYEDRPKCKLCGGIVATGAGALTTKPCVFCDGVGEHNKHCVSAGSTFDFKYRADLHEECARYIHRVMIPLRKEQLKEAANARK